MKTQIWSILCDLKFKEYCIGLLISKFQKIDRNINIFLALTSSGSIAAWVIWKEYPIFWGGIIAVSQVISAIKPYFPYNKYVNELNDRYLKVEFINIGLEQLWYKYSRKKIAEEDSNLQYVEIRKEIAKALNFSSDTIFEVDKRIEEKANKKMMIFLKNNYGITIKI